MESADDAYDAVIITNFLGVFNNVAYSAVGAACYYEKTGTGIKSKGRILNDAVGPFSPAVNNGSYCNSIFKIVIAGDLPQEGDIFAEF